MSVEEAKARFYEADACFDPSCPCWQQDDGRNCPHSNAALDRLILEVKAEMPCIRSRQESWKGEWGYVYRADCELIHHDGSPVDPSSICPSCTARAELAKVAV